MTIFSKIDWCKVCQKETYWTLSNYELCCTECNRGEFDEEKKER